MSARQGEVWWADLPEPVGSEPGFRRPVVVLQGDAFNRSGICTVVCLPMTGHLGRALIPGNIRLSRQATGLPFDSVAVASQILTVDRTLLLERSGVLARRALDTLFDGLDRVLGRA